MFNGDLQDRIDVALLEAVRIMRNRLSRDEQERYPLGFRADGRILGILAQQVAQAVGVPVGLTIVPGESVRSWLTQEPEIVAYPLPSVEGR